MIHIVLDDLNRKNNPNRGVAGANKRSRARGRALRALNPEVEEFAAAIEAVGALDCPGELSEKLVTYLVLSRPDVLAELAADVRANGSPGVDIAANLGWALGNRKAACDQKGQWS